MQSSIADDAFDRCSNNDDITVHVACWGARQGSRDWTDVSRRWITNPTDLVGVYEAISEAIGDAKARVLALAREWLDDVVESQRESREVLRQGLGDVRVAVERAQERAPNFLRRGNRVRSENGQEEVAAEA
jgi:hypothetical protein